MKLVLENINAIVFDFDGVLTENSVYVSQDGSEQVKCSRADGLAFDVLKKISKPVYILSSEKNNVVQARAKKLEVPVLYGVTDKVAALKDLTLKEGINLLNILYVGNDLNDYHIMKLCGFTACPSDSHYKIKEISDFVLKTPGGGGIARELIEDVFNLEIIKILYDHK